MPNPPNNNDLQREKVRFLNDSLSLKRIIRQGSIANSSRDNVVAPPLTPSITPTISITPSITPTISLTPTTTPPVSPTPTRTPSVSQTPTATTTPTISITPTRTLTPTITPTITVTPSITPSITPTITVTPSITPTITVTPSITPNYSYITLLPLTAAGQDIYITNIENYNIEYTDIRLTNGLYKILFYNYNINNLNSYTFLQKYQLDNLQSNMVGLSSTNNFQWVFYSNIGPFTRSIFSGPLGLGNLTQIPFSGYQQADFSIPYNAISGVYVYPDYKFNSIFARTSAVSAVIVRGLTGTAFNDTLSTVNGLVLNKSLYYGDIIKYEGYNLFYTVLLYYSVDIFANNYWILEITPNDVYNTYIIGFSGKIGISSQLPFSGLQMSGDYLSDEINFRALSGQINQPNLQLLNADKLFNVRPTPTPTPTITITPSVTPTISLTPTITITPSVTRTNTPTITPTLSITPSVTPTISLTPTITITPTTTRPTPTPTPTVRPDTFPFNTTNITVLGFYGNMEGVEYGISYDFSNTPVLLTKLDPPYDYVWQTYYEPYNCYIGIQTVGYPVKNSWVLYLSQEGEYGFGLWDVATNNQSISAIPVKNWTLSPGSSGGVIILNG